MANSTPNVPRLSLNELSAKVINARYGRKAQKILDEYFSTNVLESKLVETLTNSLIESINNPVTHKGYTIPSSIENDRQVLLGQLNVEIQEIQLITNPDELKLKLYDLFVNKNFLIKYCTRQWLLLTPGVALEFTEVESDLDSRFLEWINKNFNSRIGDLVVQRHVISNTERDYLKAFGISVPFDHWSKEYYVNAMKLIQEIVLSNPDCKGIISDGSWVYNPKLYEIATDGLPYASFDFLKDNKLVGHRFFYMTALPGNEQENQYTFATYNRRRQAYIDAGELSIDVYLVFYPREELLISDF